MHWYEINTSSSTIISKAHSKIEELPIETLFPISINEFSQFKTNLPEIVELLPNLIFDLGFRFSMIELLIVLLPIESTTVLDFDFG